MSETTVLERIKTVYQRAFRALKFDKSVYKEVVDDPEATTPAILMPFIFEAAFLVIIGIALIPLWLIYGGSWTLRVTPAHWAVGIGIGISASIVFVFGTFLVWVASLFLIGRFAGIKELQIKQVLRISGVAYVPLFLTPFVIVATIYTAVLGVKVAAGAIILIGGAIVFILLFINNVIAFREVTDVTTGVSIMSNTFAFVLYGILSTLMAVAYGLSLAGLAALM